MMDAHKDAHQIVPNVKEQLIITHHAQTKMLSLVTLFVEGALLMIARHVKKEMQHVQPATMTSRCIKAMHITMLQLPKFINILHIMHLWLLSSMKSHMNAVKHQEAVVLKVNHVVVLTITMNTSIKNLPFLFITTLRIKMETMELFDLSTET
ncbi:hypothetical protein M9Y10_006209 [Tritrichomonas musculus]|uniref:Uncharacterized protein n=1 Tax=Tritrichomonas musculus TaxID=1915356 RepID=A0ABR2JG90_9EUKA